LANRALRREVLDRLHKQESSIQAQERKEKAFEQLQRVRDKAGAKDGVPAAAP
jgi:ribosome recycling factor